MTFKILGFSLLAIGVIMILVAVGLSVGFGGPNGPGGGSSVTARDFTCDVGIDGSIFGEPQLGSVSCLSQTTGSCGFSFPFGILDNQGNVVVVANGNVIASKSFDTGNFGGSDTVTISDCVEGATSVKIRLLNDEQNIVDSTQVSLI